MRTVRRFFLALLSAAHNGLRFDSWFRPTTSSTVLALLTGTMWSNCQSVRLSHDIPGRNCLSTCRRNSSFEKPSISNVGLLFTPPTDASAQLRSLDNLSWTMRSGRSRSRALRARRYWGVSETGFSFLLDAPRARICSRLMHPQERVLPPFKSALTATR